MHALVLFRINQHDIWSA